MESEDTNTVEFLARITHAGLSTSLKMLARSQIMITPGIETFLARCGEEEEIMVGGMKEAAMYGNTDLLRMLSRDRMIISGDILDDLVEHSIMADSPDTCEAVLGLCDEQGHVVGQHLVRVAEQRRINRVRQIVDKEYGDSTEIKKQNLKCVIMEEPADVLHIVPKTDEFPYNHVITKIIAMIRQDGIVSYDDLIKTMHIPPVHYDSDCPPDCLIQIRCGHMREVERLVEQIKMDLENHFRIFSFLKTLWWAA